MNQLEDSTTNEAGESDVNHPDKSSGILGTVQSLFQTNDANKSKARTIENSPPQPARIKHKKVYILCHNGANNPNYTTWVNQLRADYQFIEHCDRDWMPPKDAGIIVTHHHYRDTEVSILRNIMKEGRVPVLILADGILEHRNTFEHPGVASGAVFQPVLGHKVACIGRSQARTIESWGNPGKTEVVGLSRLDEIASQRPKPPEATDTFKLLVATARQPGFTKDQTDDTFRALFDLQNWLASHPIIKGRKLEVIWRLTGDLASKLNVENTTQDTTKLEIHETLQHVDAVITTPSTLMLEGALHCLPVAILDYSLSPLYVSAPWVISAEEQIAKLVPELADPPPSKMLFQESVLQDSMEIGGSAGQRMAALVEHMIDIGWQNVKAGEPIQMPRQILHPEYYSEQANRIPFDLPELFPKDPYLKFSEHDPEGIQAGHMAIEIAKLNEQILGLRKELSSDKIEIRRLERNTEKWKDNVLWLKSILARSEREKQISKRWSTSRQNEFKALRALNVWLNHKDLSHHQTSRRAVQIVSHKFTSQQNIPALVRRAKVQIKETLIKPTFSTSGVIAHIRKTRHDNQLDRHRARIKVVGLNTVYRAPRKKTPTTKMSMDVLKNLVVHRTIDINKL